MRTVFNPMRLLLIFACCWALPSQFSGASHSASLHERMNSSSVRIGVLSLFHPHHLTIAPADGQALVLKPGSDSFVLETSSGVHSAPVEFVDATSLVVVANHKIRTSNLLVSGRAGSPTCFTLAIPQKISRRYCGTLEIKPSGSELIAVVTMDLETAVASIVASEADSGTPLEALKAQAIATRSYLVSARGRHTEFDFCDTTHCQFLREPPAEGSSFARAALETRGQVLTYNSEPFAAMYTRSCSGHTRTPSQIGMPSATYPYYSVECKHCISHPSRWYTQISPQDAKSLVSSDESSRLALVRRIGWAAVPSNDFTETQQDSHVELHGTGEGHGVGLCQAGAKSMATEGATAHEILEHYFPNTNIIELPPSLSQRDSQIPIR